MVRSFLRPLAGGLRWLGAAMLLLTAAAFFSAAQAQPAAGGEAPAAHAAGSNGAAKAEKAANPYGFQAMLAHADVVALSVLAIVGIMSLGSWYITFVKVIEQTKILRQSKDAMKKFWDAGSVRQGADLLAENSPYRFIAEAGLDATKKHGGMLDQIDLNTWVTMGIQRAVEKVQGRLQDGLAFLATVGSTSPFIGLFGTVWGILNALTAIGVSGQASIDKVAGPVGEALIMTALGLAVAVPAVLGYNWLVRRNKVVMDDVRAFGADLHAVLLAQAARERDASASEQGAARAR